MNIIDFKSKPIPIISKQDLDIFFEYRKIIIDKKNKLYNEKLVNLADKIK
jgi:hypothetical protein